MRNNNEIQKKKTFVNSIEPLKKNYFIFFTILKLSTYNICRGLFFLDNLYQKKVCKKSLPTNKGSNVN